MNLVLYLVERFAGHDRANLAARVLLVDGHRPSQPLRVAEMAASFGLSERTLSRRFAAATGGGPRAYFRHARIEHAKRLLETAGDPIEVVRRRAGYGLRTGGGAAGRDLR